MIERGCVDCGKWGKHSFVSKGGFSLCRDCALDEKRRVGAPVVVPAPAGPRSRPSELAERL